MVKSCKQMSVSKCMASKKCGYDVVKKKCIRAKVMTSEKYEGYIVRINKTDNRKYILKNKRKVFI